MEAVPEDFFIADISCGSQRHLLMATTLMLTLLCSAKNWFMDATFRLVRAPFRQLFSIHAFVRQGDALKQVPLVHCLMSGKSKHDYRAVIKTVLKHLPRTPALTTITVDFEAEMWTAIRTELPAVTIKGCSFHWTQSVWRKIQDVGLVTTYNKKLSTHKFLKRVMALPFLPASAIRSMFATMKSAVENGSVLEKLMCYIENTWMNRTVWPVESWSVYGRSIRTDNDTEEWHRRLNNLAKGQNGLNMYMLIKVLHNAAVNVSFQVRFVSEGKLKPYQRRKYKRMQGIIMKAWDDWETGTLTASGLLKTCARVHGPVNN